MRSVAMHSLYVYLRNEFIFFKKKKQQHYENHTFLVPLASFRLFKKDSLSSVYSFFSTLDTVD